MSYRELNIDWLEEIIVPAIDELYQNPRERDLLERDVNERTVVANICCKAYVLLLAKQRNSPEIEKLSIDLEYNRNFNESKYILRPCRLCNENCLNRERPRMVTSYPDLIIHQRGSNEDNQVVIEFKKEGSFSDEELIKDEVKLSYFTCQKPFPGHERLSYQFRLGYFIELKADCCEVTPFRNAKKLIEEKRTFEIGNNQFE